MTIKDIAKKIGRTPAAVQMKRVSLSNSSKKSTNSKHGTKFTVTGDMSNIAFDSKGMHIRIGTIVFG